MREWWRGKLIYFGLVIFCAVVLIILLFIIKFGSAYRGNLSSYINNPKQQELKLKKKKDIKRITFRKQGEISCLEMTPDGVVRQYSVCGNTLTDVQRLSDSKNITKLFKLVSENELENLKNTGGEIYELTIQTDTGTQVVYMSAANSPIANEIIQTVEYVHGDLVGTSPTPTSVVNSSAAPINNGTTPSPQNSLSNPSPTPDASATSQLPFVCDFIETSTKKKPFNVSNVICSSEPVTAPN